MVMHAKDLGMTPEHYYPFCKPKPFLAAQAALVRFGNEAELWYGDEKRDNVNQIANTDYTVLQRALAIAKDAERNARLLKRAYDSVLADHEVRNKPNAVNELLEQAEKIINAIDLSQLNEQQYRRMQGNVALITELLSHITPLEFNIPSQIGDDDAVSSIPDSDDHWVALFCLATAIKSSDRKLLREIDLVQKKVERMKRFLTIVKKQKAGSMENGAYWNVLLEQLIKLAQSRYARLEPPLPILTNQLVLKVIRTLHWQLNGVTVLPVLNITTCVDEKKVAPGPPGDRESTSNLRTPDIA